MCARSLVIPRRNCGRRPIRRCHSSRRRALGRRFRARVVAGELLSCQFEKRYFHKSGRIVWALLYFSAVTDSTGRALYFVSQIIDITAKGNRGDAPRKRAALSLRGRIAARRRDRLRDAERSRHHL